MKEITIQTAERVVPMIYAYTTPQIRDHDGWTKIGYTEHDVTKRIRQQTHTADILFNEEWRGNAIFEDGSGENFTDKDFHRYLRKIGIDNTRGTEWFHISGTESKDKFNDFRTTKGILESLNTVIPYTLRNEQALAIEKTVDYSQSHENGEFLWNAKPRFGKTLSAYDFCKQIKAQNVLIVTNRPSIANSWYTDYERFFGPDSGYLFVSNSGSLQGKKFVLTREQYISMSKEYDKERRCIEFISLQDLKGSIDFGGKFEKNTELAGIEWDVLIIDEAHEGVDTNKTNVAFNQIKRKFTLHLSGTPFKALANDKFNEDAIFNWTYTEEQKAKCDWDFSNGENPYETLPQLNLFTYQMSEIIKDELEQGIEIHGETEEYAFDLNEFFATKGNGTFVHDSAVDKFLDAITSQVKFPFSTDELRNELKHTLWLLNRVDSAKALARKLEAHPFFKDYKIVLAAGDGKMNDNGSVDAAFDRVNTAIAKCEKTITLSVGKLTTGVTIPEWTAVMMLSNIKSPALYMQAAFRAQNPCLFKGSNGQFYRKERSYVFDFDPARTLTIFEEFANDLSSDTSDGYGDTGTRKEHVRELLNFFPVIGEDENGEMIKLDAEKVLSIPRKIRSQEVVRRGFMSNYLFQNISNIFGAPQAVLDIIQQFTPADEPKSKTDISADAANNLPLDENGDVKLDDAYIIGQAVDIFGPKIFNDIADKFDDAVAKIDVGAKKPDDELEKLKAVFHTSAVKPIIDQAEQKYVSDIKISQKKRLERKLNDDADRIVEKSYGEFTIRRNKIEQQRKEQLAQAIESEKAVVNAKFDRQKQEVVGQLKQELVDSVNAFLQSSSETVVRTVEIEKKEKEKQTIEDAIRDHLRGFSRTIPSFLMAYGDENTTLADFDDIIPDEVFKEVTSISLEQFRFLRDGGDYSDEETGENKHFDGRLFDPVVFDDSVKEFLRLRVKLANYFDETYTEDIFDYIPPQKTNQIFTPKTVVKQMVDMLEKENPGCFDNPDKTFLDPYMKSGMYITEIVKRLYQSNRMQGLYPDSTERLQHIFEKQVYGLAPTEIIYCIAMRYILGFSDDVQIQKYNFKQVDVLPLAQEGTLETELDNIFGKK